MERLPYHLRQFKNAGEPVSCVYLEKLNVVDNQSTSNPGFQVMAWHEDPQSIAREGRWQAAFADVTMNGGLQGRRLY